VIQTVSGANAGKDLILFDLPFGRNQHADGSSNKFG
jgi:hypothetical protein